MCTVSEMFAKQLIQVPQSSAAKAHAILDQLSYKRSSRSTQGMQSETNRELSKASVNLL